MNEERALPELLAVLRWRWKLALAVALCVLAGAAAYVHTLPSEYDGKAVMAFAQRPNVASASSDTVRVVVPKYVDYVEAPSTIRFVATELGESARTLSTGLSASLARDTGTVTIRVRLRSPIRAATAANAFTHQLIAFARSDPLLSAQLIAPALPPSSPAAPPRHLYDLAGLAVGILLGIGISVLLERGRRRARTWRDMSELTGYRVLGRIPTSRRIRKQPMSAFADPSVGASFRTLRANLEPLLRERGVKLLVVTSPLSSDGKTTVASLLAESLSRLGAKTLLVDADLRRPRLAGLVRLAETRGLADALRDGSIAGTVSPGWRSNLFVLPTRADHDAGDLLARRFSAVATALAEVYDFIVVDTPPLLGTDDARAVATGIDASAVLLVVAAGALVQSLNDAVLALEALGVPMLGIVANRVKEPRSYDYQGSYS